MAIPRSDGRTSRAGVLAAKHPAIWNVREIVLVLLPMLIVLGLAAWFLLRLVEPAPPTRVTIATGGTSGAYFAFAKRYAATLARAGITLEVRSTAGSLENEQLLREPSSGVDLAMMQGGILAGSDTKGVQSLGRAFIEPLWVFYRGSEPVEMLAQLAGRRLAVGAEGSGTRHLALTLLRSNQIDASKATLMPLAGKAASDALIAGEVDAVFLAMAPESSLIQSLVREPSVRLMSFAQAEAYARLMPFLQRIALPRGSFDLARNVPDRDIALVAPVAAVVARTGLHPAVSGLMIEAMREVHGKGGLFNRIGEFPVPVDPEIELGPDVERYYKAGPSFLKRYLPFWLATFVERMLVLALPLAGLMVPIMRGAPMLYRWQVKRRLLYWYARIKAIEASVMADSGGRHVSVQRHEIDQIEQAVSTISVPLAFSEEYYNLRNAIHLVRQRILAHAGRVHPNLT